jgi:hypothetical protein
VQEGDLVGRVTVKCPYCGAGFQGTVVSSTHLRSCQRRMPAAPAAAPIAPTAPGVIGEDGSPDGIDDLYQRFAASRVELEPVEPEPVTGPAPDESLDDLDAPRGDADFFATGLFTGVTRDSWAIAGEMTRRMRNEAAAERLDEEMAGLVSYFEDVSGFPGFNPDNAQVTRVIHAPLCTFLDAATHEADRRRDAGEDPAEVDAWLGLQEHKVRLVQHWRWSSMLDCEEYNPATEEFRWNGPRALREAKDVIGILMDPATDFPKLVEARTRYQLCPRGAWHRTHKCTPPDCHDRNGRRPYGYLPNMRDNSLLNRSEGLGRMPLPVTGWN